MKTQLWTARFSKIKRIGGVGKVEDRILVTAPEYGYYGMYDSRFRSDGMENAEVLLIDADRFSGKRS